MTRPDDVRRVYVVDQVPVGGRLVPRVREVLPGARPRVPRGVHPSHDPTPRQVTGNCHLRGLRTGAVVAAVLGVLTALGWALWFVLSLLFAYAFEVGVVVALGVLLAGGTGGCTVIVIHKRG